MKNRTRGADRFCLTCIVAVTLCACGGAQNRTLDNYFSDRAIPERHIREVPRIPTGLLDQIDTSMIPPQPFDHELPMLRVNGSIAPDPVLSDTPIFIRWSIPHYMTRGAYLRISDQAIEEGTCPPAGADVDTGIGVLDGSDGYSHPLRGVYISPSLGVIWDPTDRPPIEAGNTYYFQTCAVDLDLAVFTGESSNIVRASAYDSLPDLAISSVTPFTSGRNIGVLSVHVTDWNARSEYDVYADEIDWTVSAVLADNTELGPETGTVSLTPTGRAWFITETVRLPNDARFHDVTVAINGDRAQIESDHTGGNTLTRSLRVRSRAVVLGIESVTVNENCDEVSPGDWVLIWEIGSGDGRTRLLLGDFDAPDATTVSTLFGVRLPDFHPDAFIRTSLSAVDCDWFSPLNYLLPVTEPMWYLASTASWGANLQSACDGAEEWWEMFGGRFDEAGTATASVSGIDAPSRRVNATGAQGCGNDPAFAVNFRLMTPATARAAGFTIFPVPPAAP